MHVERPKAVHARSGAELDVASPELAVEVLLPLVVQAALTACVRFGCAPSDPGQAGGHRWDRLLGSVAVPAGNGALCSGCSCPIQSRLV